MHAILFKCNYFRVIFFKIIPVMRVIWGSVYPCQYYVLLLHRHWYSAFNMINILVFH